MRGKRNNITGIISLREENSPHFPNFFIFTCDSFTGHHDPGEKTGIMIFMKIPFNRNL